jgi:hypothetical protein
MGGVTGRFGRYGKPDNMTPACECGNVKKREREACERCMYLDGANFTEACVIDELREGGTPWLEFEPARQRMIYRGLAALRRTGRVVVDETTSHAKAREHGRYTLMGVRNG